MEKWELTDEELANLIDIPLCPCDEHCGNCAELRKVATAAGEKARRELAREIKPVIHDWFQCDCAAFEAKHKIRWTSQLTDVLDVWLKERGL